MSAKINYITDAAGLDRVFSLSEEKPVALFKHSDTCGISLHVFEDVQKINGELNVIVVQTHRELSNAVAERTGYTHQSPQAFVLADGKAIYHATHYGIDPVKLQSALDTQ